MAMLCVKDTSVRFARIQPAGFRILWALGQIAEPARMTLTCGTEGHGASNPHTRGEAVDVSVAGWSVDVIILVYDALVALLGSDFTVLYECPTLPQNPALAGYATVNPRATAPHLHIQIRRGLIGWPDVRNPEERDV